MDSSGCVSEHLLLPEREMAVESRSQIDESFNWYSLDGDRWVVSKIKYAERRLRWIRKML